VPGTSEKLIKRLPYIIAYAVDEGALTVLRIVHGARHWPKGRWPQ